MNVVDFKNSLFENQIEEEKQNAKKFLDVVENTSKKFMAEDLNILYYDYHNPINAVPDSFYDEAKNYQQQHGGKNLFIVNWGWHTYNPTHQEVSISNFCFNFLMCPQEEIKYSSEALLDGEMEIEINIKNVPSAKIGTIMKHPDGYYVMYTFIDVSHCLFEDAKIEQFFNILFSHIFNNYSCHDILNEESLKEIQNKGEQTHKFTSISQKYRELNIDEDEIVEEMLSKVDIRNIRNILISSYEVRTENYGAGKIITDKTTRNWLIQWAKAKKEMYVMMGRNLSISVDVNLPLDDKILSSMTTDLINSFPKYSLIIQGFTQEEYRKNQLLEIHSIKKYYDYEIGMKMSKFCSKLFQDSDFDIELSKILQAKDGIFGTSRISIDPYDYLTAATNKHGWHSCHDFIQLRESPLANLAYLFDNSTMVAFLENNKTYDYNYKKIKFSGNSKMWRQLIFLGEKENDIIFAREYPQFYYNNIVAVSVRNLLEKQISDFCEIDNLWTYKLYGASDMTRTPEGRKFILNNDIAYDDLESRAQKNENYYVKHKYNTPKLVDIEIQAKPDQIKCCVCGEVLLKDRRVAVCHECEGSI